MNISFDNVIRPHKSNNFLLPQDPRVQTLTMSQSLTQRNQNFYLESLYSKGYILNVYENQDAMIFPSVSVYVSQLSLLFFFSLCLLVYIVLRCTRAIQPKGSLSSLFLTQKRARKKNNKESKLLSGLLHV